MNAEEVDRTITRIANEIIEKNKGIKELVLIGIRTRGLPLAQRIADKIMLMEGKKPPIGVVDITLYRDDLTTIASSPQVRKTEIPFSVTEKITILVDDVLFTGRTVRSALDALIDFGRPKRIQLAVLIDRGHRELPIQADYVGRIIPTSLDEVVDVLFIETDTVDAVYIHSKK
ncbi:MAG: bifunctional pyr operon transcriptional regulator/uracil phosphoribosyltransferase [Candidatus Fischerbacteria bacterium RBG_13_37_8]|uniref:Bifunctional protein PyrR n=1 Tax=Candidatus Fischerbacteria bacterium RBG_13_37_8 TaxID=1817863 RepID=A0A1F5VQC4_9BACT|nr:MAG: bifunctional pyr operon transcriptional regulator/uracil phosphoribosyltransferase [Candidatus Fischerbacteria bacterium RBG_13_37_8]